MKTEIVAIVALAAGIGAAPTWAQNIYSTPYSFSSLDIPLDPDGYFNPPGSPNPCGLALDSAGNLYEADQEDNTIRMITPAGVTIIVAGTPGIHGIADGPGPSALFWGPEGITIAPDGTLYVSDTLNNTIRKITPAGVVSTLAGSGSNWYGYADGTGAAARFYYPCELGMDAAGNLFVADWGNDAVREITPAGVVSTLAGMGGQPGSVDGTRSAARFSEPEGAAVDSNGNVYVTDNCLIRKITPAGVVSTLAGAPGVTGDVDGTGSAARFSETIGIAVDGSGNVYVTDGYYNDTVRMITPAGVVTTLAGLSGIAGDADGIGSDARFNLPTGIAVDPSGTLYVADVGNNRIRVGVPVAEPMPPPAIASQPQSTSTTFGGGFSLSVTASGHGPLAYQWYLDAAPIVGATSATYAKTATAADVGSYFVTVSNADGGSVVSNVVTVTLSQASGSINAGVGAGAGSGGGGAPSLWFCLALALLAAARLGRNARRLLATTK